MSKLPRVTGKAVIAALKRAGFEVVRIRGSHHFLAHRDGRTTVVPVHAAENVGPGLLRKILNDCELSKADFDQLL